MTIVFLHAFPLDERMWEPQRAAVTGDRVVTPRLYGRGRTMAEWADSVAAEVEGPLILVGASMGGYCALALARRFPERVQALLLVGARPDADSEERRRGRAATLELIQSGGAQALWEEMRPKLFADEARADPTLLFRDPSGLVDAVHAIRDRADSTELAREFDGPLRFLIGEHDPFVSAAELGQFDVREFPGSGHLPNLEQPDEFNAALADFISHV